MIFEFRDALIKRDDTTLISRLNWRVNEGDCWWICGENGSGKTTLLEVITGHQRIDRGEMILAGNVTTDTGYPSVALIRRDFSLYHLFNSSARFYQQRFFSCGVEETPVVIDFISQKTGTAKEKIRTEASEFKISDLLDKHIVSLSTGEGRRILLLMLWLTNRKVICFDDPYAGLDHEGKQMVNHALGMLLMKNVTILITCAGNKPPDFITHVLFIKDRAIGYAGEKKVFLLQHRDPDMHLRKIVVNNLVKDESGHSFKVLAKFNNVTIKYDNKIVQENFSWQINKGEKWILTGPNGSGKSTLMSLIYGDNPMAYAYKIVVFDKVRGTGETIWDIKKPIGYFSPELQQFFPRGMTLYEAVLSGFSNHFVVRNNLTGDHYKQADQLIEAAGLTGMRNLPLMRLSFSQSRIALVCRALVKLSPVIILDEPCQGLDDQATTTVNNLIDIVCHEEWKTLIYITHQKENIPAVINRHLNLQKIKTCWQRI